MDLESEISALESVDDNSVTQQSAIDDGRSLDKGSCSDESVKLVSTCTERTSKIDEVSRPVSFDSPGGATAYSPISKGRGLRKWRRIRRDLVKDTSANMENSKALKRGFLGSGHSNGKQIQVQSPEVEQESQGSVGSVNMLKSSGDGFDVLGSGYDSRFVAGVGFSADMDLEKDDDQSSKSSTAARAPKVFRYEKPMISSGQRGKILVENSKKHRGENGDEGYINGETSKKKEHAGEEGKESINQNNSEEIDPLTEAIDGFLTLQEALEKEVQKFCGIGKESINHEGVSEVSSPCTGIETLVNNVEQLETKLEDTRSMLEAKETHIRKLESTTNQNRHTWGGTETLVEDIFRQRIESQIEYLIYSRSIDNLKNQMNSIEEQKALEEVEAHEALNKLGEVETKATNLTNRAKHLQKECREINGTIKERRCKTTLYLIIQLVLLVRVVLLFMSQLLPESDIVVVPT